MAEEQKQTQQQVPVDMPEGKMELSLRILSNELIGIKMSVDDMKMKWVVIGVGAIGALLWAASAFGPTLTSAFQSVGG
jgi:hypothetical protein|tara:strand:+ start:329 stop:562 length:234 start_codon:yes stop_codon:yes gene_type:complete